MSRTVSFKMTRAEYDDLEWAAGYIGDTMSGLIRRAVRRVVEAAEARDSDARGMESEPR